MKRKKEKQSKRLSYGCTFSGRYCILFIFIKDAILEE